MKRRQYLNKFKRKSRRELFNIFNFPRSSKKPKYSLFYPQRRKTGFNISLGIIKNKFFWGSIFLCFLISALFYGLFISDFLKIKLIQIKGLEKITEEEIKSTLSSFFENQPLFLKSNFLLTKSQKIGEELSKSYPKIASAKVKKIFPDELLIQIEERKAIGVYCKVSSTALQLYSSRANNIDNSVPKEQSKDNLISPPREENAELCFYIDKEGVIFDQAPRVQGSLILTIKDIRLRNFSLGDRALEQDILEYTFELRKRVSEFLRGISLKEFLIRDQNELELVTFEGWRVYLNTKGDPSRDLEILDEILKKEIGPNRANLEYIDLRIPNQVYYK